MAKSSGRGYKRYLHSCSVNDVSPRVLRRLNYNPPVERRDPNVEFKEHFSSAADDIENVDSEMANEIENNSLDDMDTKINSEGQLNDIEPADIRELQNVTQNVGNLTAYATELRQHVTTDRTDKTVTQFSTRNNVAETVPVYDDDMRGVSFMNINDVFTNNGNDIMKEPVTFVNDTQDEVYSATNEVSEWDSDLFRDLRDDDIHESSDICRSHNLVDFMSSEDFLTKIETPVDKSRGEIFLMVLQHSLRYKSCLNEHCSYLQVINAMFSHSILPDTPYSLNNIFSAKNALEFHGICPNCSKYIGKITDLASSVTCEICSEVVSFSGPASPNVFVIMDPAENIHSLLQENEKYYSYVMNGRTFDGTIRDVFDGKQYRLFKKELHSSDRQQYVTATFNTDGAPRFECSQYSIWPIYLQLNEIPIEVRLKRIITCGMWFGKNKPEMTAFLKPFNQTMIRLSTEGIECTINNENIRIKVYALICCADSVARAPIQGVKLFNGKYGCNWCLHEGEWFEGSTRYPILQTFPEDRSQANMMRFMAEITNSDSLGDVYGVKYTSPLTNLPYFDIVNGFVPDYMHCCLAGVGKQMTKAFLKCIRTTSIEELNKIILQIKVPQQLGRAIRSFEDINNWKAKEWENFILYYSLPLFNIVLHRDLVNYWTLFINSLHTLLKCDITKDELNKADEQLHKFVFYTEKYFSKKAMTFNIHQLLHLSKSVMNWGPLWCHSTFSFESANHDTLRVIHSAKGVNLQIARFINMRHAAYSLQNQIYPYASPLVINYCEELSTHKLKKSCKVRSLTYLGNGTLINEDIVQKFGMSVNTTLKYERAIKDGCLFSSLRRKNARSDNSFAILADKTVIRIIFFLLDNEKKKEVTLCHIVNTSTSLSNSVILIRNIGNEIVAIDTTTIVKVCPFIKVHESSYIAILPNIYHY